MRKIITIKVELEPCFILVSLVTFNLRVDLQTVGFSVVRFIESLVNKNTSSEVS